MALTVDAAKRIRIDIVAGRCGLARTRGRIGILMTVTAAMQSDARIASD